MMAALVGVPCHTDHREVGHTAPLETNLQGVDLQLTLDDDDQSTSSELDQSEERPVAPTEQTKRQAQKQAFNLFIEQQSHAEDTQAKKDADDRDEAETPTLVEQKIIDKARGYQQELFERAQEENVIVVLETGSGKTLVACLLARWMLEQERIAQASGQSPKIIFFLANSNHLVQQQGRFLTQNLSEQVIWLTGNGSQDLSQETVWRQIFQTYSLVVCTPAILEQCLMRAFLDMTQISLLIFDEAHHTKKDHPYSKIMRSYYMKCDEALRPKIFGMTASPMDSKGEIAMEAQSLEELLQSKIVTSDDISLLSFAPKPKDVKWTYPQLQMEFETDLYRQLSLLCRFSKDLNKAFEFARKATSQLGSWCADRVWQYYFNRSTVATYSICNKFEQSVAYLNLPSIEERQAALAALHKASLIVQNYQDDAPPTLSLPHLSPKVILLYRELSDIYQANPNTRAIVFVNERLKALLLHDLFQRLRVPNLRSGVLLGIAGGTETISVRHQEQILDHFRAGLVNLVFATSVAEEGLDIPQCNLCIRFDMCKTTIQYMQSRGRARMRGSLFVHMIEADNQYDAAEVDFQIADADFLKNWCAKLPPDRLLGKGTKLAKLIAKDSANRSFKTSSGAICDFSNSLLILSRFAASLKHIGAAKFEVYEEEIDAEKNLFRYLVRLPSNSQSKIKGCRGEWRPNKQLAKRSAAFGTCYLLRKADELDANLDSIFKKVKPENLNAHLAVSAKTDNYEMLVKPTIWQDGIGKIPSQLYAKIVHFQATEHSFATLVLFTRKRLPVLPASTLFLDHITAHVELDTNLEVVDISSEQLRLLTVFTLEGVFADVFNKVYVHEPKIMSYWLAPAKTPSNNFNAFEDIVDLQALRAADKERLQWHPGMAAEAWTDQFLCDPLNGKFHYFTGQVIPDASIFDPVPAGIPKISQKKRSNIIDFSDSTWTATKKKALLERKYDVDQPIFAAHLVGTRRDFLESSTKQFLIPCHIAPQPLQVARIETSVALSCLCWPAIIHRIESHLIVLEAFDRLQLPDIPSALALEAFTKGADDEDGEEQSNSSSRRAVGKNYERLEFIGDSLLKLTTTMTVFIRTNCDEEGMHCRRMEIICNRRLYNVSTDLELFKYARTTPFTRNTWYPERLSLLHGRGAKKPPEPMKHADMTQRLSMKTIADISEAIIGAAVVASRDSEKRFDLGIEAITKLVRSEDHNVNSWDDIRKMYTAPDWSLLTNDPVANDLALKVKARTGYQFKHPRLLRSAFTHSSDNNATVPDLQRLEFLGDAVLDWVCINWLFESNPTKNPQWLTEHKMAMVSNKFLAALAVVLEFDRLTCITTAQLLSDIQAYATKVHETRGANPATTCRPDFWTQIDNPPKALSDLVEAYLGAVLLDSDFDYGAIEAFFDTHVKPFFEDIEAYDTFANRHPTTYLYTRLRDEFRCRDFSVLESTPKEGVVEVQITAGVVIHGRVVASSRGTSGKYARVRASKQALALMEDLTREEFKTKYGCDCTSKGKMK